MAGGKNSWRKNQKKEVTIKARKDPVDSLKASYELLDAFMKNPKRRGYAALIKKIRYGPKEPINLKLFDFKKEVDSDIKELSARILKKLGMDDLPDGIK